MVFRFLVNVSTFQKFVSRSANIRPDSVKSGTESDQPSSPSALLRQQRAMEAVSVLTSLQKIKAKAPIPQSLFLQAQMLYSGSQSSSKDKFLDRLGQVQLSRVSFFN